MNRERSNSHRKTTSFTSRWALLALLLGPLLFILSSCKVGWYIRRTEYATYVNPETEKTWYMKKEVIEYRVPGKPTKEVELNVEYEHNKGGGAQEK